MRALSGFGLASTVWVFLLLGGASAAAQTGDHACRTTPDADPKTGIAVRATPRNTLVFDHYRLVATKRELHVLEVEDGGYLQVRFVCTDPRKFNYTITAHTDEQQKTAAQGVAESVETNELSHASLTMRHSKLFTRYRVEISLRDDLKLPAAARIAPGTGRGFELLSPRKAGAYILYSTFFDLWVNTRPEWTVDFSGGIAFTGLRGHEYFIKTDTKGTADGADDVKTVEEDVAARPSFRPDIIALANVRHPRARGLGMSFGVGLNNDADPKYFLGLSYLLGGKFILNGGWAGGKINELPVGQELHKAPINGDNTLTTPAGRFRNAFYFGIGFTFINREDQFKGAFAAAQKTADEEAPAMKTKEEDEPVDELAGTYTNGADMVTVERKGAALTIKLTARAAAESLVHDGGLTYHVGADSTRKVRFLANTTKKIQSVEVMSKDKSATYTKQPPAK